MKKTIITSLATFGLALGAFAQGQVSIDNSAITPSLTIGNNSTFYSGPVQVQVWYDNNASIGNLTTIQSDENLGTSAGTAAAYALMQGDGFSLAQTLTGTITVPNAGSFSLGAASSASMNVGTVTLSLVAINSTTAVWNQTGTSGGLVTFVNPTTSTAGSPPPTAAPLSGWNTLNQNLIMTPAQVPEPTDRKSVV